MTSFLLLQYPACLVCLILIVFVMGGKRSYSCCFLGCCLQGLFNIGSQHSCEVAVNLVLYTFSYRPCSASIEQYRHDRCMEETAFYFISKL